MKYNKVMRKTIMSLMLFLTISVTAQEKIFEFTTTHYTVAGYNLKSKVLFELYKDSLTMTFLDKKVVKSLLKKGISPKTTYVYQFNMEQNDGGVEYIFRNETEDYLIRTDSKATKPKPSIRIRTKDTFSGEITDAIYFSI